MVLVVLCCMTVILCGVVSVCCVVLSDYVVCYVASLHATGLGCMM